MPHSRRRRIGSGPAGNVSDLSTAPTIGAVLLRCKKQAERPVLSRHRAVVAPPDRRRVRIRGADAATETDVDGAQREGREPFPAHLAQSECTRLHSDQGDARRDMKTAVVLRHAERQDRSNNWSHLSQAGIEQARSVGSRFDRFDLVVTSPLPRAFETAVAMGFAVTRTHFGIQDIGEQIMQLVNWSDGFPAWAAAYRKAKLVKSYVDYVTSLLTGWLDEVAESGSLLVITHGGIVEAMAAGLLSDSDWAQLGEGAGYVEGFAAVTQPAGTHKLAAVRR